MRTQRSGQGDSSAPARPTVDTLFPALAPRLYRRAFLLTGTPDAAERLTRHTYRVLAARPHRVTSCADPYTTALATLLRAARKRRRWERPGVDAGHGRRPATGPEVTTPLAPLSRRAASVILLVDLDGYTVDQAAAVLGLHPDDAVHARTQALAQLTSPQLSSPAEAEPVAHQGVASPTTTASLRAHLQWAEEHVDVPAGLYAGLCAPPARATGRPHRTRPTPVGVTPLTLLALVAVAVGVWWLSRPAPAAKPGVAPAARTVTVFNAETPCRPLRTLECALRLARDPYARYARPDNVVGRVWHDDQLLTVCVVTDGTLVRDESGITSARWYRVATRDGVPGWLPGVRTRNTAEVRTCAAHEAPTEHTEPTVAHP